ncbi:DUF4118 domain-containing protein (plasmid) [Phenylobacterium sp. LH3H17]|uniref:DUF4118 domain-containing protein n=1 Tax=Phenylobacterium sp. LH3H17 TaxID=2903901 RepID=UPI0020C9B789|nr:DUF4118 domain-containing protein [Phenylobacterium sp. LH3H17]UTP41717.1 DUF4118 domain-containing protein [Phenylobacterium sp. LH3H17]
MTIESSPNLDLASSASSNPSSSISKANPALGYGAAAGLVALTTLVAFVVEQIIPSPTLALIFVLPVLTAALSFGWGPAVVTALASVASFDFFFTVPKFSMRVDSPADVSAIALLLIVAAIASAVAAQSRRRGLEAQKAAHRAEALHRLAHLVVEAGTAEDLCAAGGAALSQIFFAPAVVMVEAGGKLTTAAIAGGVEPADADREAANWALANGLATRAEQFPFDKATYDFWPVKQPDGRTVVLGVKSGVQGPDDGARYIEMVGAYLLAGLKSASRSPVTA